MYGNDSGKRTKGPGEPGPFSNVSRRRPTLPPRYQGSTIGAGGLNFRVRNGTGCLPSAMAAETVGLVATAPGLLDRNPGRPRERPVRVRAHGTNMPEPVDPIASASKSQVLGLLVP